MLDMRIGKNNILSSIAGKYRHLPLAIKTDNPVKNNASSIKTILVRKSGYSMYNMKLLLTPVRF